MPDFAGPIKFPVPADRYNTAYGEPQWWKELAETAAAAISAKADAGHTHAWAQITGKPTTFTPAAHTHVQADVTGLPAALTTAGQTARWADVSGKPSTFPPAEHTHAWADVSGKPTEFAPAAHDHTSIKRGDYEVGLSSAGAFFARAGGANTVQFDANTGNMVAGNVPWARITDVPVDDWSAAIAALNAAAT